LTEAAGTTHLQIEELLNESAFSSNNGSYLVDFRNFQFLQSFLSKGKYVRVTKVIGESELKKKLDLIRDEKSILLDLGSTFLVCNNTKMLINIGGTKNLSAEYQTEDY